MRSITITLLVLGLVSLALAQYDYADVIRRSLLFYEAQRTGVLPANNRVPWRGNSFVTDRGVNGENLSGGYFDAGDHVKFGFPFASAMTMLAWGMLDSRAGYERAGQWSFAIDALRWGTDYMIRIHPSANELYVQVGNGREDHAFWGRPEQWTGSNPRPALRATPALPATEVACETAAALAAASMVFRNNGETAYANTLLNHAIQLYNFGNTFRGRYSDSFPEIQEFYNSWSGFEDELFYSAAWMYRATGNAQYRTDYNNFWHQFGMSTRPLEISWDDKQAAGQILLAKIDGSHQFVSAAQAFCDWVVLQAPRTPRNLVFISPWGSLRHASNVAFGCLQLAQAGINAIPYRNFARQQIDYMLGSTGRSFVVGFGVNPPQRPHHTSSSCPNMPAPCDWSHFHAPGPNPQTLHGALVGGPDINDNWADNRDDYVTNEVAIDYNAAFQGALAEIVRLL
ncbi:endoglucanase E-4-like [Bradysia coprophila]|uniref:endoglucanase E-4-like n=1 Tax=Bradysia coprophila TaxID=38358 RepID=UPI00187DD576|nr:endoglucanase E-4-like [Bradysia coprophila]